MRRMRRTQPPGAGLPEKRSPTRQALIGAREAFTLVEVLVATVLLALVGGVVMTLSTSGRALWVRTDSKLASMTDAQRAVDRLTEDLRKACQNSLNPPDATTVCGAGQLSFRQIPSCAAGGPVITYRQAGSSLTRQAGAAAATTVAGNVTAFTPTCQTGGLVRLSLTAQTNSSFGIGAVRTLESTVWVQNNP